MEHIVERTNEGVRILLREYERRERARHAIEATEIGDFTSNLAFLDRVIAHPLFGGGKALTSFVDAYRADLV